METPYFLHWTSPTHHADDLSQDQGRVATQRHDLHVGVVEYETTMSVMGAEVYEAFKAMGAQMKKQARLDRP